MSAASFRPLDFERRPAGEMRARAEGFYAQLAERRSVRSFSPDPIPPEVLDACIAAAGCAPSGAHQQPWTFVVVTDPELRREIRIEAESEETRNYHGRMSPEWLRALAPFGTDEHKPFLELAPALIVVFRHAWSLKAGERVKHYYTQESVGIAVGFLLAALHNAGLAALTHTPSPMGFLERILARPASERAYLLIPVGYPSAACTVPDIARKSLEEIRVWRGPGGPAPDARVDLASPTAAPGSNS